MKNLTAVLVALSFAACGGSGTSAPTLNTAAAINAYLDGKTLVMTGADIPPYPNGFNENTNYGSATQCYNKSTISILSGVWTVTSILGTLNGAASTGATGTCDTSTPLAGASPLTFTSTGIAISNVVGNATCFDIAATYSGFAQEGRGAISADGKTVTLELYFSGQVSGDHCANGAIGSGVTLNGSAFTMNAEQVYVVQ